jgi:citrate synthase
MDKIYSRKDMVDAISKVEELTILNAELEELLYRGSNDEKLVERKRELEVSVRNYKTALPNLDTKNLVENTVEEDLISLKADYDFVVSRYKQRKIDLETIIRSYTNGNSD